MRNCFYVMLVWFIVGCSTTAVGGGATASLQASEMCLHVQAGEVYTIDSTGITCSDINLVPQSIVVEGTLIVEGSGDQANPTIIEFDNVDESTFVGGGMVPLATDPGLWVVNGGRLIVRGTPVTPWARLQDGVSATATTITLDRVPTNWVVGQKIAIAPTVAPNWGTQQHTHSQSWDEVTITAIAGASVTFTPALTYNHPAVSDDNTGARFTAEVIYLGRDVVIQGTNNGRSHVMFHSASPSDLRYFALRKMGPDDVLGRYPLHMHHNGTSMAGTIVRGVLVDDSANHAFVPHESDDIRFYDAVAYNTHLEAFWWDLGDVSNNITLASCLAARTWADNGDTPRMGAFGLGDGTGNRVLYSVAVGFDHTRVNGWSSGFLWQEGATSAWEFIGNLSHNNYDNGTMVWQNNVTHPDIMDFTAYNNRLAGIHHGAYQNAYAYHDSSLFDNAYGIRLDAMAMPAGYDRLTFENFVVSARTHGVYLHGVANAENNPVLFRNVRFVDNTSYTIEVDVTPSSKKRLVDFVECGLDSSDIHITSAPVGSLIRVQDGDSAFQVDHTGTVTTISPFYP